MFEDSDVQAAELPVPTPQPMQSKWVEQLGKLLQQSPTECKPVTIDGLRAGNSNIDGNVIFDVEPKSNSPFDSHFERCLFTNSKSASHIRRSLSSINSAKAFVYSSTFFGDRKFYADEFDFKSGPIHPTDRRKIRFGLKSIADFVIQVDLHHLKSCFLESDPTVEKFTDRLDRGSSTPFPDDSLLGLLYNAHPTKAKLLLKIMNCLISNMNFSQSMGEFLASDGSIETSKLVLSEALKQGPDLGNFLRGGPFASCAQVYRNLSSRFDFDSAYFVQFKNNTTSRTRRQTENTFNSSTRTGYRRNVTRFPYPTGFCYTFQKGRRCYSSRCQFKHYCAYCEKTSHGADDCQNKRPAYKPDRSSSPRGKADRARQSQN